MIILFIKMDNKNIFKALSSETRIKIIKILMKKEIHLSQLAKEIGISVPVTLRHVNILIESNLVKKRIIGNVHLLSSNIKVLEEVFDPFIEEYVVKINENDNLLNALDQIPNIKVQRVGKNQLITSIDGQKGFFIYEVNGKIPKKAIDEYKPKKESVIELKKLVPINKKKIKIYIKKNKEKNK
jgi:DNA-binding transcriptional ArsR family regulator